MQLRDEATSRGLQQTQQNLLHLLAEAEAEAANYYYLPPFPLFLSKNRNCREGANTSQCVQTE